VVLSSNSIDVVQVPCAFARGGAGLACRKLGSTGSVARRLDSGSDVYETKHCRYGHDNGMLNRRMPVERVRRQQLEEQRVLVPGRRQSSCLVTAATDRLKPQSSRMHRPPAQPMSYRSR
jgi:hypothetical protein